MASAEPMFEICLWRSDLLTSVVELDASGHMVVTPDRPQAMTTLYPAGEGASWGATWWSRQTGRRP